MKIKNIVLVLVAALLVLLHPGTVEASSTGGGGSSFGDGYEDKCGCGGDFMTKYIDPLLPIYRWRGFNHKIYDGYFNNYTIIDFPRSANGDLCFFVEATYSYSSSNSNKDYSAYVIYISQDEFIDCYDNDGNVIQKDSGDFSSHYGSANGKYYAFDGIKAGSAGKWVHEYDDGYNYFIHTEGVYSEVLNKIEELAIFLCGGDNAIFPDGVTAGAPLPVYDLEAPLGVTVSSSDNSRNFQIYGDGLYQGSDLVIPYKVWWNQSNIDLSGYETEFYVREYGKYKKSLFSSWVDVMTPYIFDKSFVTAKYCNNSLKYYEFSPKDKKRIYSYCQDEAGEEPYAVEFYHPDFMLRNKKEDENGQMHYSNWVYVKTYDDGTYSVFEMEQEYDLEEDPDETGNIDVDSPNYDDEIIYEDTDYSPDIGGVKDSAKFITVLKDLANSLGDFPDLFAQIFSFLPSWVLVCIGTLFVVIMLKGIF